jgi:hypothetical protein
VGKACQEHSGNENKQQAQYNPIAPPSFAHELKHLVFRKLNQGALQFLLSFADMGA